MNLGTSFCKHPSLFGRKIHLDVMPLVLKSDVCRHRILYPFLANNMHCYTHFVVRQVSILNRTLSLPTSWKTRLAASGDTPLYWCKRRLVQANAVFPAFPAFLAPVCSFDFISSPDIRSIQPWYSEYQGQIFRVSREDISFWYFC